MAMSKTSPAERANIKADKEIESQGTNVLVSKLLELRKLVVPLTSNVKGSEFNYPDMEKVIKAIRPAMDNLKIILKEETLSTVVQPLGDGRFHIKATQRFTWIDTDSNEREVCLWEGHGIDCTERALAQAQTNGEKTFLIKNLQIPVNRDDSDSKQKNIHKNEVADPGPQEPPSLNSDYIENFCIGLRTRKDWERTWDIIQGSEQYLNSGANEMDAAMEKFNQLYSAWESCQ